MKQEVHPTALTVHECVASLVLVDLLLTWTENQLITHWPGDPRVRIELVENFVSSTMNAILKYISSQS